MSGKEIYSKQANVQGSGYGSYTTVKVHGAAAHGHHDEAASSALLVRNPAPNASAPAAPQTTTVILTISG